MELISLTKEIADVHHRQPLRCETIYKDDIQQYDTQSGDVTDKGTASNQGLPNS